MRRRSGATRGCGGDWGGGRGFVGRVCVWGWALSVEHGVGGGVGDTDEGVGGAGEYFGRERGGAIRRGVGRDFP